MWEIWKEIVEFFRNIHDGYELTGTIIGGVVTAVIIFLLVAIAKRSKALLPDNKPPYYMKNGVRDSNGNIITPYKKDSTKKS